MAIDIAGGIRSQKGNRSGYLFYFCLSPQRNSIVVFFYKRIIFSGMPYASRRNTINPDILTFPVCGKVSGQRNNSTEVLPRYPLPPTTRATLPERSNFSFITANSPATNNLFTIKHPIRHAHMPILFSTVQRNIGHSKTLSSLPCIERMSNPALHDII